MLRVLIVMVLVVLAGCAPRGRLAYLAQPSPEARTIFVGSTRAPNPETGQPFGTERSFDLRLAKFDVATPPDHQSGTIDYPKDGQPADPQTQFMVSSAQIDMSQNAFRRDLRAALARQNGQAVVFVHGFNNDFSEGLYRMAQLGTDFDLPGVFVHYSWPSRAHVLGYAYDRDSALFARDGLSELLEDLQAAGARQILLIGHSLGAQLTMEVLRQEALGHDQSLLRDINGVILISPDIAVDVFLSQAQALKTLPQPFVIFTSQRDRALQLSARLSGAEDRLGDLKDFKRVARYKITIVDVGAFSVGDGHFDLAQSPALIKLLDRAGQVAKVLTGEQIGRTSLASAVILTVDNATQIVLSPLAQSGG
ncbi:alpha/beta fold hydrolase [uncultured Thioclava sp.]|uniref:Alpha/beta fold hydrolase n=1 Tax=Thioclava arctica TaxID=3238301 RepID=A0ABV3TJ02_9RHOB|nr:alpha/beta fold hydrolase [uncultured Thioclava sp.]